MTIRALLGALSLLAALPAAAQAAKPLETQRFKVSIRGVQTTAWSYDVPGGGLCNPGGSGEGTEVVRFATGKPKVVEATRFSPTYVAFGAGSTAGPLSARAKVTRHSKHVEGPLDRTCVDPRGGGEIGTPDCGTKHSVIDLRLSYESFGSPRGVILRDEPIDTPALFKNCPVGGIAFPDLLDRTTNGNEVAADWPVREIMDRRVGKTIVIGRGRKLVEHATGRQETTVRWEVTFRRIGRARAAAMTGAGAADADADADAVCTVEPRRAYSLAEAKRGMPVHVTCDRSTAVFAAVNLAANDPASRSINPRAHPGAHGWSRPRTVDADRASRFEVRLQPFAARAAEQARGSRVIFSLGIEQSDGRYHNNPNPGGYARSRVTTH